MVNLHRRKDGGWSYTAYTNATAVFVTNNCHATVFECIEEIDDELKGAAVASGGRGRKTAAGSARPIQAVGSHAFGIEGSDWTKHEPNCLTCGLSWDQCGDGRPCVIKPRTPALRRRRRTS